MFDHDDSIEYGNSEKRDEAHPCRNTEGHVPDPEQQYAPYSCQGDGGKDNQGIPQGTEREIQQYKNQQQGHGYRHKEAGLGRLQVFKLPPVSYVVPHGQLHMLFDEGPQVVHHGLQVPVPHIDSHHDPATGIVPGDLGSPFLETHLGNLIQGDFPPTRGVQVEFLQVVHVFSVRFIQADHKVKALFTFKDIPDRFSGKGHGDDLVYICDVQAVAGDLAPVIDHLHLRQSLHFFDRDVRGTRNLFGQGPDFLPFLSEDAEVFPEHLNSDIGPDSGNQFVETHLDGLGKFHFHARDYGKGFFEFVGQLVLGAGRNPFPFGFQGDDHVTLLHTHGVGGHFSGPDTGDHLVYFRKRFNEDGFNFRGGFDGFPQACTCFKHGLDHEIPLVKGGDEFPAHPRE